jgi:hypothetical protein
MQYAIPNNGTVSSPVEAADPRSKRITNYYTDPVADHDTHTIHMQ